MLGLALGPAGGRANQPGEAKKKKGDPTAPKFNIPIPVGHSAEGVNLPYFDDRGKLQMYYEIKKATRTDLNHMAMEAANIQTYDDKGAPETNVVLTSSTLDLNTRIVTSDVPVTVQRSDMELTGDKMTFNTQTRNGRIIGHVRVVVYNSQGTKPAASPSPSPSPTATAAPATTASPSASPTAP